MRRLLADRATLRTRNLFPELDNLMFHLGVATSFSDTLEIGFDLAIEL